MSEVKLIQNLRDRRDDALALLDRCNDDFGLEDLIYRFYHTSFKVYRLQDLTTEIVAFLTDICPDSNMKLDGRFTQIIKSGTGKTFHISHNNDWSAHTRPIVEAAMHAHYMLRMLVKYAGVMSWKPHTVIPSGWAAVLTLYWMR